MDLRLVHQPQHYFRFFDLFGEPKKFFRSINDYEQISIVTLEEAVEPLVIFIPQVKDMVKLVKEKCQQPKDNLSIDESASIMLYTMEWMTKEESFYYIFNRKLNTDDDDQLKPWYFYMKLISISLSKVPILSRRIFYRGVKYAETKAYSLGRRFLWRGYSSCASSIDILNKKEFGFGEKGIRTLFIIHSDSGINISEHSFYKTGYEILLPPGQRFEVVSYRESNNHLRVIILKEISIVHHVETVSKAVFNKEGYQRFELLLNKRIKKCNGCSEISFRNQKLTDNHLAFIVDQGILKEGYTWLSFQNNQITSQGVLMIADELKENTSLESLYLSQNRVDDIGVIYLTDILSNNYSELTLLSLDHNCIKDDGASCLAEMLKQNRTLTDLWLSYNEIGSDGVKSLASALTSHNETLIQLYLHGNKLVNDSCIDFLVRMLKSSSTLNTIWLQDCSLSQEGKEKLEKAVNDRIDFDLYV